MRKIEKLKLSTFLKLMAVLSCSFFYITSIYVSNSMRFDTITIVFLVVLNGLLYSHLGHKTESIFENEIKSELEDDHNIYYPTYLRPTLSMLFTKNLKLLGTSILVVGSLVSFIGYDAITSIVANYEDLGTQLFFLALLLIFSSLMFLSTVLHRVNNNRSVIADEKVVGISFDKGKQDKFEVEIDKIKEVNVGEAYANIVLESPKDTVRVWLRNPEDFKEEILIKKI